MSIPTDLLLEPVAAVVDLVLAADGTLDRETMHGIVKQVAGGRAKSRRLAAALAEDPAVLRTGRSPAPKAVGDLLLVLRAAGAAGVAPPRCADCDREITSMQRRGELWYCSPCFTRPQPCVACGQVRQVAFRDRHGQARCSRCPDQDARDPRHTLVETITSVDPQLSADTISAALEAVVTKPAHIQKLAWAIERSPDLLSGEGAKAPFPMLLRLIDALCDVGATAIQRPACPRCSRVVALSKQRDGLRICRNCYAKANAVPCSRCSAVREPATRDPEGNPLCPTCLVTDPVNLERCARCGRRRQVSTRIPDGALCPTCVPRQTTVCSVCGRTTPCITSKITGMPWCGACARLRAICSRCGRRAAVRAGTRDEPLCGQCAQPDPSLWKTCPGCGEEGRLIAGACARCRLHRRLHDLLGDPAGEVRPELRALHEHLASVERPATALTWLRHPAVAAALTDLGDKTRELSHTTLDELPPGKPLEHLRSVLVATGTLPERDEQLTRLERWITHAINERCDPQDRELLRRYAVWHLLRRLRQRNHNSTTTYAQLDTVRQQVTAALDLLGWLHTRELTLATCRQADLDAWKISADSGHHNRGGHFVRWAISRGINRDLRFPATRWTGPAHPLDHEERWKQARRLLHDTAMAIEDRVAGLLLLLYAQRPATISRLSLDDIDAGDGTVALHLGSVPVVLPEPLAALVGELIAMRRGHAVLGRPGASPWLFPGGQPGRPVSADRLGQRLRHLGLQPAAARSTALFQLATELPAAILARTLGIHIKVAVAWQHLAAGDWTAYAADVSRKADHDIDPTGRGAYQ